MKSKKKKGSSFVIVLFITAIIFTTATTMIAVVTNDYKTRINQSKSLQNLYKSDANLDYAYASITKNCQMASAIAANKVEDKYKGYSDKDIKKEVINNDYKKFFIEALTGITSSDKKSNLSDGTNFSENKPIFYGIENKYYADYSDSSVILDTVTSIPSKCWKKIETEDDLSSNAKATIKVTDYSVYYTDYNDASVDEDKQYSVEIKVKSTFENKNKNKKKISYSLANKKTIKTKFTIKAPDYTGSRDKKSTKGKVDYHSDVDSRAITADGDMYVDGKDLNIDGDIWIKGDSAKNNERISYSKYYSGIVLGKNSSENTNLTVTGDICTPRTLTLQNKASLDSQSNIYALNVYLGALKFGEASSNNNLKAVNVYTNNDLTMNSETSNIDISDTFYGINGYKDNADKTTNSTQSSSIIVNKTDSKLKISKAFVMGVAYIDAGNDNYQTGESVAIKGNYKAYSTVLPSYQGSVDLESIDSVKLIKAIKQEDGSFANSSEAKAKYFVDYYNSNNTLANAGGVEIDSLQATGASINKDGEANISGLSDDTENNVIPNCRNKFAQAVFNMEPINQKNYQLQYKDNYSKYSEIYVKSTTAKELSYTEKQVSDLVNFKNFGCELYTQDRINTGDDSKVESKVYSLLLNGSKDTDKVEDITLCQEEKNGKKVGVIKVGNEEKYVSSDENIDCIIFTDSNVKIEDNVKLNGSIVATGNVTLKGDNISIKYDSAVIKATKLALADSVDFNGVYSASSYYYSEDGTLEYGYSAKTLNKVAFDADTYVKEGLWQLEK